MHEKFVSYTYNPGDVHPQRTNVVAVHDGASGACKLRGAAAVVHFVHLQVFHRLHRSLWRGERKLQRDGVHDIVHASDSA